MSVLSHVRNDNWRNLARIISIWNCEILDPLFIWSAPAADEQELATHILSLCHGIFTD